MKKIILATLLLTAATGSLSACSLFGNKKGSASKNEQFGEFSYKSHSLKEYAVKEITAQRAKNLISITPKQSVKGLLKREAIHTNQNTILYNYASLTTTIKYYEDDKEAQQVRSELYQGTEFYNLLDRNNYEPFGQMNVHYLYVDETFIDRMEEENANFLSNGKNLVSPFKARYTYHEDSYQQLIIQIHDFAELPASVGGGIGSSFRQDSELVFDNEGKISLWQSSLGLYSSTPTGTIRQGYIFEAEFAWTEKE